MKLIKNTGSDRVIDFEVIAFLVVLPEGNGEAVP